MWPNLATCQGGNSTLRLSMAQSWHLLRDFVNDWWMNSCHTHGPCEKAPKQLAQRKNCHWKLNFRFNNQANSIGNRLPCQHSLHSNPTCKLGSSKLKAANKGFPSPMSQISSAWQWQAENGRDRNLNIPTCKSYPNLTLSKTVRHYYLLTMHNNEKSFWYYQLVAYTMLFKNSSIECSFYIHV